MIYLSPSAPSLADVYYYTQEKQHNIRHPRGASPDDLWNFKHVQFLFVHFYLTIALRDNFSALFSKFLSIVFLYFIV